MSKAWDELVEEYNGSQTCEKPSGGSIVWSDIETHKLLVEIRETLDQVVDLLGDIKEKLE